MSQVQLRQNTGPASAAGTSLFSASPVETGTWTEVAGLTAAIPTGGAFVEITADSATVQVAIIQNGRSAPPLPPHNGRTIPLGATRRLLVSPETRVFTKTF